MMEQNTGEERLESLKTVYSYLETRYQEQIDLLKQVEMSVKARLTVLSAVLGIVTFFTAGTWKLPQINVSTLYSLLLIASIIPLFLIFTQVFFIAMKILERQCYTPGFELQRFINLAEYTHPSTESVYEDFVKNLSITIAQNEDILEERNSIIGEFRTWNKAAVWSAFLPIGVVIAIYVIIVIL